MGKQQKTYLPNHLIGPGDPTLRNRFACRVLSHFWHALDYNYQNATMKLICMRCSRYIEVGFPTADPLAKQAPEVGQF